MEHEHLPWVGAQYEQGIEGSRILIAGWSHHGLPDRQSFTNDVVGCWADGDENAPFAPRIRSYFGDDDPATFWNKVAFINTLPTSVGDTDDNRYSKGTPEQQGKGNTSNIGSCTLAETRQDRCLFGRSVETLARVYSRICRPVSDDRRRRRGAVWAIHA